MEFRGELIAHKTGPGAAAVRMVGDSGRKITGDSVARQPTQSISAPRRENESNTSEVCQILMETLNQERTAPGHAPWTDIAVIGSHNSDVDALIYNKTEELAVQVTRPALGGEWQKISTGATVATSHEIQQATNEIKVAIERKKFTQKPLTEPPHIAELRRRREQLRGKRSRSVGLVLAIDCIETPALVLDPAMIDCLQLAYGAWARSVGLSAIWLVGSTAALTRRIK